MPSSCNAIPDSACVNETERTNCRRCAAPLSAGVPGGLCAACLGGDLFSDEPDPVPFTHIGDYELLEEIGRGGMGLVYRARQVSVNRAAAVKLILTGPLASVVERQRFVAEAEAAAALDHPGIVAVYEAGEEDGQPFFAMQLIEGESLSARLARGAGCKPKEAAELIRRTSLAVQHAHERGFLHRDLKPGNILLDAAGAPHVTDFGLARRMDDESKLTLTGAAVGTPSYMAPEQTDTRRPPTTAVDVYGLGAILYELLSGHPPFREKSLPELFVAIREKEAASISAVRSEVDRDLDIICRKCLEKEPARRYRSSQALADDLQHWLSGEPISARPVGKTERLVRWCRRRPAIAGLAAAAAVFFLAGLTGIVWQWRRADKAADSATAAQHDAEARAHDARTALYAADMNLCQAALKANNLGRARRLLDAHRPAPGASDLRGWEWRYLWAQCRSSASAVLPTAKQEVRGVLCSLDGATAVSNDDHGRLIFYDIASRSALKKYRSGFAGGPLTLAPDGLSFLCPVTANLCEIWDFSPKVIQKLPLTSHLAASAFSPDGTLAAVQCFDGTVRVFHCPSAAVRHEFKLPPIIAGQAGAVAFVPGDPLRLAVGSEAEVRLYRCDDWNLERSWTAHKGDFISALAVSPDGTRLATGACFSDAAVRVWDTATGEKKAHLDGHTSWISALLFARDGSALYCASADQTISVWRTDKWIREAELRGHTDEVWGLNFAGDGLISAGKNGEIMLWPGGSSSQATGRFQFPPDTLSVLDAGTTGDLLAMRPGFITRWKPGTWQRGAEYPLPGGTMQVSNTGMLAIRRPDDKVQVLDGSAEPPQTVAELEMPPFSQMQADSAGRWLVFRHEDNSFTLYDIAARRAQRLTVEGNLRSVLFDDRAIQIIAWIYREETKDYAVLRYDVAGARWLPAEPSLGIPGKVRCDDQFRWMAKLDGSRAMLARVSPFEKVLEFDQENSEPCVCFSPNSQWLAIANEAAWARLWRLPENGVPAEPRILRGHLNAIFSMVFTPDSSRLVTLCANREAAKFWDPESGVELLTLSGEGTMLLFSRFTQNGETLLASRPGQGNVWQAWHAPSLERIAEVEKRSGW